MAIKTNCHWCNASFQLKDELAWKKWKCPNCSKIITIPSLEPVINTENNTNSTTEKEPWDIEWLFSHDIYGLKQKKIAINEKYFIRDKDNNELLYAMRKAYVLRGLLSAFTFICVFLVILFFGFPLIDLGNTIGFILLLVAAIFPAIFLAIFVSPKKHIRFFKSASDTKKKWLFEIKEDSKFQMINKTYTMINKDQEVICKFRKNIFTDVIRKKWHMEFDGKHIEIKEDSIILWLLRRFMPFWKLIRTNFIFTDLKSQDNLWIFKRKFELFDNYSLDLSNDRAYRVPRQLSIWMAVLLDTGEKR